MEAPLAVKAYGGQVDYIIMSWPPQNGVAFKVLNRMRLINPDCGLIYIGTSDLDNPITTDHKFHSTMHVESNPIVQSIQNVWQGWGGYPGNVFLVK